MTIDKQFSSLIASFNLRFEELRNLCRGIAIFGELTNRSLDAIASVGELLSSQILSEAIRAQGLPAQWIDARKFMITDNNFASAAPQFDQIDIKTKEILSPLVSEGKIIVTQGFIGSNAKGTTTTLRPRRFGLFRFNYWRGIRCRGNPNMDRC